MFVGRGFIFWPEVLGSFLTDDLLLKLNAVELMDAFGALRGPT
jgi:hypothetical protein